MRGPVEPGLDMESAECAGTELDARRGGRESSEEGAVPAGVCTPFEVDGGGSKPPERKDGQRERSSGSELPPVLDGDM